MKWSDFKALVDAKLKEAGAKDPNIDWIDIGCMEDFEVIHDEELETVAIC